MVSDSHYSHSECYGFIPQLIPLCLRSPQILNDCSLISLTPRFLLQYMWFGVVIQLCQVVLTLMCLTTEFKNYSPFIMSTGLSFYGTRQDLALKLLVVGQQNLLKRIGTSQPLLYERFASKLLNSSKDIRTFHS